MKGLLFITKGAKYVKNIFAQCFFFYRIVKLSSSFTKCEIIVFKFETMQIFCMTMVKCPSIQRYWAEPMNYHTAMNSMLSKEVQLYISMYSGNLL